MRFKRLSTPGAIISLLLFSWIGYAIGAESVEYVEKKTLALKEALGLPAPWYATAYQPKSAEKYGNDPALLCFGRERPRPEKSCFSEKKIIREDFVLQYQFVDTLDVVSLAQGPHHEEGVMFVAISSYGGSGWSRRISIWTYSGEKESFINILPSLDISNQGEYRLFPKMKNGLEGILVAADAIVNLNQGESHFSPHKYAIKIYQLGKSGTFKLAGEYVTKIKYPSLDDTSPIDVIGPELQNIEEYLSGLHT